MNVYFDKERSVKSKRKKSFFTTKTPVSTRNKNADRIMYKTIYLNDYNNDLFNSNTINPNQSINKIINKKHYINISNLNGSSFNYDNTNENDSYKDTRLFRVKDFKKNFTKNYFTNYYDINNNNYFVNLYDASTSLISKNKDRNSVINNNFYKKVNTRNLTYNSKNISFHKTKNNLRSINGINKIEKNNDASYLDTSVTIEMMKNYRNKLLIEFIKYLKKFYKNYYKKYFIYFLQELKSISIQKTKKKFIYSKKIQKANIFSKKFKKISKVDPLINKRKAQTNKYLVNKAENFNSMNLSCGKLKRNNIFSKIINNQSDELVDGQIRNIFLDSSFLNEQNLLVNKDDEINNIFLNKNISTIEYYSNKEHKNKVRDILFKEGILSDNKGTGTGSNSNKNDDNDYNREIKINLNLNNEFYKKNRSRIYLRNNFNHMVFIDKNNYKNGKRKTAYESLTISNSVQSFSIICCDKGFSFLEGRKKYVNLIKNRKFLSSIKEEDEKYSLSIQDSIVADNTKIVTKENNGHNPHFNLDNLKFLFKSLINDFYEERFKKLYLSKIKTVAFVYKINKVLKNNMEKDSNINSNNNINNNEI
jgi:hypothetical protein